MAFVVAPEISSTRLIDSLSRISPSPAEGSVRVQAVSPEIFYKDLTRLMEGFAHSASFRQFSSCDLSTGGKGDWTLRQWSVKAGERNAVFHHEDGRYLSVVHNPAADRFDVGTGRATDIVRGLEYFQDAAVQKVRMEMTPRLFLGLKMFWGSSLHKATTGYAFSFASEKAVEGLQKFLGRQSENPTEISEALYARVVSCQYDSFRIGRRFWKREGASVTIKNCLGDDILLEISAGKKAVHLTINRNPASDASMVLHEKLMPLWDIIAQEAKEPIP